MLEGLPHRAFGHLTVAAEHPDTGGQAVEVLGGESHANADRQALSERARGHVHPRDQRGRMSLEHAAELAVREQLLVTNGSDGAQDRVVEGGGMSLREDQPVVRRLLRVLVVVAEVVRHQHRHQVGGGHP